MRAIRPLALAFLLLLLAVPAVAAAKLACDSAQVNATIVGQLLETAHLGGFVREPGPRFTVLETRTVAGTGGELACVMRIAVSPAGNPTLDAAFRAHLTHVLPALEVHPTRIVARLRYRVREGAEGLQLALDPADVERMNLGLRLTLLHLNGPDGARTADRGA